MIKYKKKYTDKSFDIDKCRESAESGYAPAQYQLGECLETGTHVSRNLSKAFNWYWQAYDHCRLANEKLDSGSFYSNLARWLKNAVNDIVLKDDDLADALQLFGSCYEHGWGVNTDMTKAVEYWKKSAEMGNLQALDSLGYCYAHGLGGVIKSAEISFECYLEASERGFTEDYTTVGLCYLNGDGVQPNKSKAYYWFNKAAAHNDQPMAWTLLGKCCFEGIGCDIDYIEAAKWFNKAIEYGNSAFPDALRGLGDCYAMGLGIERDLYKAVNLYLQAAKVDDPESQYRLGRCYANGLGVEQDMKTAVSWYKKAASNVNENTGYKGHYEAMRCLADCYANGLGVRKNKELAALWHRKAVEIET